MTISRFKLINLLAVLALHWKRTTCQANLNAPYGNVTTPKYPKYVTIDGAYFSWKITVGFGKKIKLEIKDLILPNCRYSCFSGNCDQFAIHDYKSQKDLVVLCSSLSSPKIYYSSGRTIEVMLLLDNFDHQASESKRRLWFYYETFPKPDRPIPTTIPETTNKRAVTSERANNSSKLSTLESTLLVVGVIVAVFLSVLIIFVCGLKKRCSRRQQSPSAQTQQTIIVPTDEEIQIPGQPPSYDEAMRSSQTSLSGLPSYSSLNSSVNVNDNDSPPQANGNGSADSNAYDASGLPSYNEAHRLSQASLDRAGDNRE